MGSPGPGQNGVGSHLDTKNIAQLTLLPFHLIFSNYGWAWITEITANSVGEEEPVPHENALKIMKIQKSILSENYKNNKSR